MKVLLLLLVVTNICYGQQSLLITTDKTTALIFPFPIKHVDRGTKDVLVQPVKENEKILLVKAATASFKETNVSVVTSDGAVYSFTVNYADQPAGFVIEVPAIKMAGISSYVKAIIDNQSFIKGIRDKAWEMEAKVTGIYIKDDVLYYQLLLCNHSPISYGIDVLRFFTLDKKTGKRTAAQEIEMEPLAIAGNDKEVRAYHFTVLVVALEKFTIPDAKFLGVQIMEKNGGRHLKLKIENKDILKAKMLPDLQ